MATKAVTLKNSNDDTVYPVTDISLVNGGIFADTIAPVEAGEQIETAMIEDGAITAPKLSSALAYKPGDVFTFTTGPNIAAKGIGLAASIPAALTGSNQNLYFEIPMGKSLANITSATINSMRGPIRGGTGGYLTNSAYDTSDIVANATSITVDVNKDRNCLVVLAIRTSGWGGTNNGTYNFQVIDGSITLS